jgi:hypothetical protein
VEGLYEQTETTARRLLKNRLRHCVTSAKAESDDQWSTVAYVNKTAAHNAQEDWTKILTSWAPDSRAELTILILQALRAAVKQVQDEFRDHFPIDWLDQTLGGYLESFQPEDIL